MANNRMWLVHRPTQERILLCKTMGKGWYFFHTEKEINDWLDDRAEFDAGWGDTKYALEFDLTDETPKEKKSWLSRIFFDAKPCA